MRREPIVKSKSLAGVSDLTIAARIKPGLVPSLEAVSYKTRVKTLLRTLHAARLSSQEYAFFRPLSDAVERVGAIHSVRVVISEPEDKLILAATFDGTIETYIRVLWQKVPTLLDAIYCNTENYVSAYLSSYEEWLAWARGALVETEFFYSTPGLTHDDVQFLREDERLHRSQTDSDVAASKLHLQGPEALAWNAIAGPAPPPPLGQLELARQGLQALAVIYRLTDLYLPGTPDGDCLQRAAQDLLLELREVGTPGLFPAPAPGSTVSPADPRIRFARQLDWFEQAHVPRRLPAATAPLADLTDVQAGIVTEYDPQATHGCLALLKLDDAAAGAALLSALLPLATRASALPAKGAPSWNVSFTFEGLRTFGLSEDELAAFPFEFRVGMEARNGVLGDLRNNHPRRWRLPQRNWPAGVTPTGVELSAVHAVVQLRVVSDSTEFEAFTTPAHPLNAPLRTLDAVPGVAILSVQTMRRHLDPDGVPREHFGYVDGLSNPVVPPAGPTGTIYPNTVPLGEVLLGHANQADEAPPRVDLLHNGSFLAIRKLRQFVDRFEKVVADGVAAAPAGTLTADTIKAKMMGRTLDGDPLAAPGSGNAFDYRGDAAGAKCPFQAHIRRSNPRQQGAVHPPPGGTLPPGGRLPRIVRRGMSYGPRYDAAPEAERGIVFMAYNASIGEQFELIQRWIAGGNGSGVDSAQSDPFLGVPQAGDPRVFRFDDGSNPAAPVIRRLALDNGKPDEPMVQLEWGAYLFTPSIKALVALQRSAASAVAGALPEPVWSATEGLRAIERLEALEARVGDAAAADWKFALEDPEERRLFRSAAIWAAIRQFRGGALRTAHGVLVADRDLVSQVFADPAQRYSVSGYRERMQGTIGEIYLGLDRDPAATGCPYDMQAAATNAAIQGIARQGAYELAFASANKALDDLIRDTQGLAAHYGQRDWELVYDLKELSDQVLADVSEAWFGLPGGPAHFQRGGYRLDWQATDLPLYPGHFTAPSRYIFQPNPEREPQDYARRYGQALRTAALGFVQDHRKAGTAPSAPIGAAIFAAFPARAQDDLVARTLVGALMGLLPTVDGSLRAVLNEWLKDGSLWRLRQASVGNPIPTLTDAEALLERPLKTAMQLRPSPELVWRTATRAHTLGPLTVAEGDKLVLGIVSASQQALVEGRQDGSGLPDVWPIFGGQRPLSSKTWAPGDPTHACPGYEAAIGILLGVLAALLTRPEAMRPSPVPLALVFSGGLPPPSSPPTPTPATPAPAPAPADPAPAAAASTP